MKYITVYHFDINLSFPPFLLYFRCKSGVTFVRKCFRDAPNDSCLKQYISLINIIYCKFYGCKIVNIQMTNCVFVFFMLFTTLIAGFKTGIQMQKP